jgi:hypothetical protein
MYLAPITPPIGPDTTVRASSLAFHETVPPWLAITSRSEVVPSSVKRASIAASVLRDGSAAYASKMIVLVREDSLRWG